MKLEIHQTACRGCQMCAEVCPTQALVFDAAKAQASVKEMADCIACLSCVFLCPSGAIQASDYHSVRNFYRDIGFSRRVEKFL